MYKFTTEVELSDAVVHRYSLLEWEEQMLNHGELQADERPLSYGKVAEIISNDLVRYGHHWTVDSIDDYKIKTVETYTDLSSGIEMPTAIPRASTIEPQAIPEASHLKVGIHQY